MNPGPRVRSFVLFFGGILGIVVYFVMTEIGRSPFHAEWLLAFLAMCGIGVAQHRDRKGDNGDG